MHSPAFAELERLVRHLGEELAAFRRRAFQAESRVRELEQTLEALRNPEGTEPERAARKRAAGAQTALALDLPEAARPTPAMGQEAIVPLEVASDLPVLPASASGDPATRIAELEQENATLRQRLAAATTRTRQMLERVRFLRQQGREAAR